MNRKTYVQVGLALLLLVAGIRLFLIYQERNAPAARKPAGIERHLSSDDYIALPHSYVADLDSAKRLRGRSAWARTAGQLTYYPVVGTRADLRREAGLLPAVQELKIRDFVLQPNNKNRQLMMIFTTGNQEKRFAVPIGAEKDGEYTIYLDDAFLLKDPHELYKHWTADDWKAIVEHRAWKGMSEAQAAMALGPGATSGVDSPYGDRTLQYTNFGHPVSVTFSGNQATNITVEK